MRAILLLRGDTLDIYTLETEPESNEIKNILTNPENQYLGIINNFIIIIRHIASQGLNLSKAYFDCWRESGIYFCELKKDKHRISFFQYQNRLLLMTYFIKHQAIEPREYRRAIRLKRSFDENPIWEEDNG